MAVPQQLLQQLLALDESVRLEIAHALLESVDEAVDDNMSNDERKRLDAALDRSIAQADAGQGIPVEQAIAEIRARRAARARASR
jgi:DNA gyrase/topoisomerase IV subunit B